MSQFKIGFAYLLILFNTGCNNTSKNATLNTSQTDTIIKPQSEGTAYSDSMINAIVEEGMSKIEVHKFDTLKLFHSIKCLKPFQAQQQYFEIKNIPKFNHEGIALDRNLAQLIYCTSCIYNYYSNSLLDAYIVFNDNVEASSHHSESIELLIIYKNSYKYDKLVLAQEYVSENQSYVISSKVEKDLKIKRSTKYYLDYYDSKAVDSSFIVKENFRITKMGEIQKLDIDTVYVKPKTIKTQR